MSVIKVENLTFSYDTSCDKIFDNVSFQIDTNWKLGFVGRNGRGKTTFLNLLLGRYEYQGRILTRREQEIPHFYKWWDELRLTRRFLDFRILLYYNVFTNQSYLTERI